ncbi:hypothetical protein [Nocardia sp. NPDC050710]|uniref:hypothetical protein n=1 Tax=Nocardia sp. NPDC050710 TaxID=3157220 RepID=UPI0033FC4A9E
MRRLRRRGSNDDNASSARTLDPTVDPPIVAALVEPILKLRASLGTGVGTPDQAITGALAAASTRAADTEGPHRDGLYALESTWSSNAADLAVPSLRTTQTELGEISDRGPAYLEVLADAQTTTSRGAQKVDQIIADFRRDARRILGVATASPDTDAVIERGAQALRDAINTVQSTRSEMDDHTRRLDAMGPLTVTSPSGINSNQYQNPYQSQYVPGATVPGTNGQQLDPVQAAQFQLQQQLVSAGVQLGTAAISAGVDIGTHLIDKIVEVGTHAMDTVAASADKVIDKAIPELIHPGSTTGDNNGGSNSKTGTGQFDFGGGAGKSSTGPGANRGTTPPSQDEQSTAERSDPRPVPAPQAPFAPTPQSNGSGTPRPSAPENSPQHGPTGGVAMPPPAGGNDQEHKPKDGQLGVTVPAASFDADPVTVPAAVIGDFGDDFV